MNKKTIILAGNPNVGKSSVFNELTHLKQHTGNWTGKTVDIAKGTFNYHDTEYQIYDLPGTYSLNSHSKEEDVATEFIKNTNHDVTLIVCDATCLERNLNLVFQIIKLTPKVIVCINLIDEAKRKGIIVNYRKLEKLLKVPVVVTSAKKKYGFDNLKEQIKNYQPQPGIKFNEEDINTLSHLIAKHVVVYQKSNYDRTERQIDKILTHKIFGILTMFLLFMLIFWLTIKASNYPSAILFNFFNDLSITIKNILTSIKTPPIIIDLFINGIYKVLTWVISVMLPPMAIFFPLFTILEDLGYLPRIAFCLDKCFKKCQSCGKQALTMCMGFGCNAVGVTGARIIDSKRERLIAIITNSFVPCNGRFPTIIALISIFVIGLNNNSSILSALVLTLFIVFSIIMTLLVSKILSKTILKGEQSSFTIELPPYRIPKVTSVIIHSIFDRTILILGRAIVCSIPAGLLIWLLLFLKINDISIITHLSNFLNPLGYILGLDGVILLAFLLGLPANELVMPIILMIYLATGSLIETNDLNNLKDILINNGWSLLTCLNFIIFSLFHFPCATTILTIKKETKSIKWTLASILIPLIIGICLCFLTTTLTRIFL